MVRESRFVRNSKGFSIWGTRTIQSDQVIFVTLRVQSRFLFGVNFCFPFVCSLWHVSDRKARQSGGS